MQPKASVSCSSQEDDVSCILALSIDFFFCCLRQKLSSDWFMWKGKLLVPEAEKPKGRETGFRHSESRYQKEVLRTFLPFLAKLPVLVPVLERLFS